MKVLIKGGRLLDPASNTDGERDVLVDGATIAAVGPNIEPPGDAKVVDASGLWVMPGLIDMHVHLREPGQEYKENIATGTLAAAAGGFTTVCCMANTDPVNDTPAVTEFILKKALKEGSARVLPVGAVSKGLEGKELAEMGEMQAAGTIAASDDGRSVMDVRLMRRALEYARGLDLLIISHPEDHNLTRHGVIHEGEVSTRLGLDGMPAQAEEIAVARELSLLELTRGRLHFAHVSTRGAVQAIKRAKDRGLAATAEVTPHHFTLTHEATAAYDPDFKMNPPLRPEEDIKALKEGLADGTIDAIATDHAPHAPWEKEVEFVYAPFGVVGLETALAVTMRLVDEGVLELLDAVKKLTSGPAKILGIDAGRLSEGAVADIVLFDPGKSWVVDPEAFLSKGKNSAFKGMTLKGAVALTLFEGNPVFDPEGLVS